MQKIFRFTFTKKYLNFNLLIGKMSDHFLIDFFILCQLGTIPIVFFVNFVQCKYNMFTQRIVDIAAIKMRRT